ncbi:sporulation protein Cse60, partial [Bacillus sp. EKM417B]
LYCFSALILYRK